MSSIVQLALLFGAVVGLGAFLMIRGVVPAPPALDAALSRLHPSTSPVTAAPLASGRTLVDRLGLKPPATDMRLIGMSIERYTVEKLGYPLVGLVFPAVFGVLLGAAGIHLPWYFPTFFGLALAVVMFMLVDSSIRQKADAAREEFRRAVATYLTLVGLVRYAGAGAVESLELAAQVGESWVFERIRDALADARYANEAPWTRLRQVSAEIGVPDLGEVGDIMSLVGDQGAQVYQTLLSRAQSMRVALRTKEQQRAATATTLLYVPTSMLLLVFLILIGYPAMARILG
ncbi:MAG TPA: type II secretion system F family protein [Micromonosporaceae bacterium]|nr:type II secretion system F family protein [Micromonosporaceae bacterium]